MTRQKLIVGAVAAAFALSITPAWAQGRPNTTGSSSGSAAPRGGEGSSGSSSGSSTGSSTSSGSGSSGGSSSSMPGSMGSGGYAPVRERAPQRPNATERRGGGSPERAMPRGGATAGDNSPGVYGGAGTNNSVYAPERSGDRSAIPAYSRPRGGAPVVGQAVERRGAIPGRDTYYPIYDPYYYYGNYDPYYYGYGSRSSRYWLPGYGFGLGYFGYDPYLFGGYEDPYYYYGGQASGGTYGYSYGRSEGIGGVRLKVKPHNAQVYVDGYYVGVADSFDGMFQKLSIDAGAHRIEVRAEGYEPVQFDVMVTPGETVTYKGELKPIR